MLDDIDVNELADGGTSDAEGEGYECVISFKDGMKGVELARDGKEVKGAYRIKRIIREQWCLTTRERKEEGKGNC